MKRSTKNNYFLLVFLISGWISANAQTFESEVPGDNFSLEGALELFKKSASPEEFERFLNAPDSKVNNLDLNTDGNIDYVRVIDRNEGNVHAFILQAVLSKNESQDVAVIELEKLQDGKAVLQITGDADVYGIETIIEPTEEVRVNAGASTARAVVNVWAWPSVQYVYSPYYSVWASPWGWAYHPMWWRPWRPIAFHIYAPWWRPYRPYYSLCYSHRIGYLPRLYHPYRSTSVIVYNNYGRQIDHCRSNYNGRDRYDSRSRSTGGRDRFEGYSRSRPDNNSRLRSDYNSRDNNDSGRRYEANANSSRSRVRSSNEGTNRSLNNNQLQRDANISRSKTATERSNQRSSSDVRSSVRTERSSSEVRSSARTQRSSSEVRSTPERTQRSSSLQQQRAPERRSFSQSTPQRQSNLSYNSGSRQQRSSGSPSIGRSSSRSSSSIPSGSRGSSSGNGGSNSRSQRGR